MRWSLLFRFVLVYLCRWWYLCWLSCERHLWAFISTNYFLGEIFWQAFSLWFAKSNFAILWVVTCWFGIFMCIDFLSLLYKKFSRTRHFINVVLAEVMDLVFERMLLRVWMFGESLPLPGYVKDLYLYQANFTTYY